MLSVHSLASKGSLHFRGPGPLVGPRGPPSRSGGAGPAQCTPPAGPPRCPSGSPRAPPRTRPPPPPPQWLPNVCRWAATGHSNPMRHLCLIWTTKLPSIFKGLIWFLKAWSDFWRPNLIFKGLIWFLKA